MDTIYSLTQKADGVYREIKGVDFPTAFEVIKRTDLILTKREEGQTSLQQPIKGCQEGI